jgi:tetratricopeptide (TPR) repeat protein
MSRAAFVAMGAVIVAIIFANRKIYEPVVSYLKKYRTKSILIITTSLLVLCGATYGIYIFKKDSADGRLLMWKMGAKVMVENPLTGVGQGYYRGAYGDIQADYFTAAERSATEIKVAGCPEYGFNEYLHIGAETGIVGFLLFLLLVITTLGRLFRHRSYYAFGLLALLVFALFSYPLSILPIKIMLVAFFAFAGTCPVRYRKSTIAETVTVGATLATCICIGAFLTNPYVQRIEAVREWQDIRRWYSMKFYSYVVDDYPELLSLMKENPEFMFEYGRSLYMEGFYRESIDVLVPATRLSCDPMYYNVIGNSYKALGEYDMAAEAYLKAHHIIPHRMYPLYLLGRMYSEIKNAEKAVYYARLVVDMIPKIESPATRDMQQEMKELLENLTDK